MKTKIVESKKLIFILLTYLVLLSSNVQSQVEYDTLYLLPDTTTFFDGSNGLITNDMANFAVKLIPNSSWNNFKIESINLLFFNSGVYIHVYLKISIGKIPEEVVLSNNFSSSQLKELSLYSFKCGYVGLYRDCELTS